MGWDLHQLKAHQRLPNTSQQKVLLYLLPFVVAMSSYGPHFNPHPPVWGLSMDLGDRKWYQLKISSPHS